MVIGISYIDYFIPDEELGIDELVSAIDIKDIPTNFKTKGEYVDFSKNILKLNSIRVLKDYSEVDILSILFERLFATKVEPQEVDIIISVNEAEYNNHQNLAKYLCNKYKMVNANILNITGNYCANIDIAIDIAQKILATEPLVKNILIVGSIKFCNNKDRVFGSYAIMGDGGGIILLNRNGVVNLVKNLIVNNNSLYDMNINDDNTLLHFKYINLSIKNIFKLNNIDTNNIEKIIIQNTNTLLVENAVISNKINTDLIFKDNNSKYGHLAFLDLLINLKDIHLNEKNENALAISLGFKGSYITSIFNFCRNYEK